MIFCLELSPKKLFSLIPMRVLFHYNKHSAVSVSAQGVNDKKKSFSLARSNIKSILQL